MINTLDSSRLLNLKQRYGISISSGNSTGIYTISKKCERLLKDKLTSFFSYKTDLDIAVAKVTDKINDVDIFNALIEYTEKTAAEQLYDEIMKVKSFVSKIKKMIVLKNKVEDDEEADDENLFDF